MLLVQLRKALCDSTYVEILNSMSRDPLTPYRAIYTGEARNIPLMYDDRRIEKIGTSVNKCGNPEILVMLEY